MKKSNFDSRSVSVRRKLLLMACGAAFAVACAAVPRPASALDHCGAVTRNETWSPFDNPHVLTCDVEVRNSTLTLDPGVNIQLADGVSLIFSTGSKLEAAGTPDSRVRIFGATRSQEAGFWGQLRFEAGSLLSRLENAELAGGGDGGVPMVQINGAGVDMAAVTFRLTEGPPLALDAAAVGPSLERAGGATVGRCEVIDFSALGDPFIDIYADAEIDVVADASWSHFCLPYRVDNTVAVGGPDEPTLTLNPGVTLYFAAGSELIAGIDDDNHGQLTLNGSVDEPVVLTGMEETPGSWGGVTLSEFGFGSFLISARIERGGADDRSMLIVEDPNASAIDIVLTEAQKYPIEIDAPIVGSFFAGLYGATEPVVQGNAIDRVLVRAGFEVDVTKNAAWGGIGVPFEIDGTMLVAGDPAPTLVIESGAELWFGEGEALTIGDETLGAGSFSVRAAGGVPGVLTSEVDEPGSWHGVRLVAVSDAVVIDGLVLENGGQGGSPMLDWGSARGSLVRSTFRGAEAYPVALPLSSITAIVGEELKTASSRNRFEDNGVDRVLVRVDGPFSGRRSTWASPGAPIEFDGDVVIAGPSVPVIELYGGLEFYLPANATFTVGDVRDTRAAIRLFDDSTGDNVVFRSVEGGGGWSGIRVVDGSTFETRADSTALVVSGPWADDATALTIESGASVTLDHVSLIGEDGGSTGLHVTSGAVAALSAVTLRGHRVGALASEGGRFVLSSGWITGNSEHGVRNDDPMTCVTANLIWWGDAAGPSDPSDAEDGCMDAMNESGGDTVSDDVDWASYAIDEDLTPVGGIVGGGKKIYMPIGLSNSQL